MPVTIGSNITSLMAQRSFADATKEVGTAQERLASGMRINKASDDAAGLAISEQLNSDAKVFSQGIRNVNDGISAITIAETAMAELSDVVIRIEELAVQSANGSISNAQRLSLDEEAQALSKEFDRIVKTTEFNGTKLLDGSTRELRIQAGYGLDGSIKSGDLLVTTGDGTFTESGTFAAGSAARDIEVADLNSDGNADMIVVSRASDDVTIHLGNGNGTFRSDVSYSTDGLYSHGVTIGDFDGDGALDLATANVDSNSISILIQNKDGNGIGDGTFQAAKTFAVGAGIDGYSTPIDSGDFNNDGNLDLVTANGSNGIVLFEGNGNGSFKSPETKSTGGTVWGVKVADLDGDGNDDVVASHYSGGGGYSVLMGNGSLTLDNAVTGHGGVAVQGHEIADMNNDGILDIITADRWNYEASIHYGIGNGTFDPSVKTYQVGDRPASVAVGDMNGDGYLDIVTGQDNGKDLSIILSNGDGTFQNAVTEENISGNVRAVALADLDNDGALDLMATEAGSPDQLTVFMGNTKMSEKSVFSVASLDSFNLSTMSGAREAIEPIKDQLEQLISQRGALGAFEARLEVATNVLQVSTENYKAAESRIRDADIAQEAATLTRTQILQQGAAAVLAQANQQPSLALTLLS